MSKGSSAGFDRTITVFSPEGRLYQIEYAFKAVKNCGITSVGVRGSDSVCIISQKKVPDRLLDPSSVTSMYCITNTIGCTMAGLVPDCRALVDRIRNEAAQFQYDNGYDMTAADLTKRYADLQQVYTQHAGRRPPAVTALMIGLDEDGTPQLFKADPSGWYAGYRAAAIGQKGEEANNIFEKKLRAKPALPANEPIVTGLIALQSALGVDLKANEVEVGVCSKDAPRFRTLSEAEIDTLLTQMADRD